MKFWAIAYKYQENVYYNVVNDEDTLDLSEQCFLPSEALAQQIIEDSLGSDYAPIEIDLESLQENGIWSYSRGQLKEWDEA